MKQARGFTIIQLMVTLLIAGIVGWFVVDFIIDKRCEGDDSTPMCVQRHAAQK
jgi:hypothetical protein